MNTRIKKSVSVFTLLIVGCIILSGTGCKKDSVMMEPNLTVPSATTQASSAPTTFSYNSKVDISLYAFIPCANGGLGEVVILSGPLHILTSFTITDNYVRGRNHYQPQGISGIGETTGERYQATGVTQDNFQVSFVDGHFRTTVLNNFRVIGQGSGNNFLVHSIWHATINANGDVTSIVDNFSTECK